SLPGSWSGSSSASKSQPRGEAYDACAFRLDAAMSSLERKDWNLMQTTISRPTAFSESRPAAPRRWIGTTLVYVILLVAMVIAVFPILVMLLDSIKPTPLITATPPVWVFTPTWEHYQNVLQIPSFPFTTYLLNSVIVAVVS